jgi:hypothetical protein
MLSSAKSTDPAVWVRRPLAIFSKVLLPQPDGPTTLTNSPGRTSKLTSSTAWVPSGNTIEAALKESATLPGEAAEESSMEAVMGAFIGRFAVLPILAGRGSWKCEHPVSECSKSLLAERIRGQ